MAMNNYFYGKSILKLFLNPMNILSFEKNHC